MNKFTGAEQGKYEEGEKNKRQPLPFLSSRGGDVHGGSSSSSVPPFPRFSGSADQPLGCSCAATTVCVVLGGVVPGDTCQCWSEIVVGDCQIILE